jgi:hypothetical protein
MSFRSSSRSASLVRAVLLVCAIGLFDAACSASGGYRGDGQFVDHGWLAEERYVLDLGPVNLSEANRKVFRMSGLPPESMTLGFEVADVDASVRSGGVRVHLETADRRTVVDEEGPLETWRRNLVGAGGHFFYYRWGESRDVPLGNGATRPEHIGLRADSGWGSTFTPSEGASYVLSLETSGGGTASSGRVNLVVRSQPRVFLP